MSAASDTPEVTVLVDGGAAGVRTDAISVRWNPEGVFLSPEAAAHLEARWDFYMSQAAAQGKSLFNGPITRLIHAQREGGRVMLYLGPADYKTFVVTRLRDRAWFESHAPQAMTPALGSSVLLTHKDEALLGIRSQRVSAYPDRAHLLGGVLDLLGTERFSADVQGLVAHLAMELQEEGGLAAADLEPAGEWPRLLGVVQDEFLSQPEVVWRWETCVPLETIGGRLDAQEHAGWIRLHRVGVDEETWGRMTPVARYAWGRWSGADALGGTATKT